MSRADAAQFCVDNGGELAIIRSVAEQNDATTACGAHTCWIGLAEIGGDALTDEDYQVWQWRDGTSPFTNWAQGEPNNYGGNDERYVIMDYFGNGGGEWYDESGDYGEPVPLCMTLGYGDECAPAASSYFDVTGDCTVINECIFSPNWPGIYDSGQSCSFTPKMNGVLTVHTFELEEEASCAYDALNVDGIAYCGSSGPDDVAVTPSSAISFSSDISVTGGGFQICLRQTAEVEIVCPSGLSLNFNDAQQWCEDHTGGNLVTVGDAATQAWVLQHGEFSDALFSWGGTCMWIGATDAVQEGHWLWESGGALAWSDWAPGEPNQMGNEDCALMCSSLWSGATPGQWIDVGCAMSVPFCCDNGVNTPQSTATYFLSEARSMTRDEAEQSCEAAHGELATVRNSAENEAASFACGAHTCWLGLEEVGGNAATGTNQQVWQWPDGVDVFTAWAYGEPNNYAGRDEKFAIMNCCDEDETATGQWYDAPGDWNGPYALCSRANADGARTYFLVQGGQTRADAEQSCEAQSGELAIIKNAADNTNAMSACGDHTCWIGLAEVGGDSLTAQASQIWQWSDGSAAYDNWADGEPNNYDGNDERNVVMNCCEEDDPGSQAGVWFDAPGDWDGPYPLCVRRGGSDYFDATGECTVEDNCIYSPNFPADYESSQTCDFTPLMDGTLTVNSFELEAEASCAYDALHVDGAVYCGDSGPDGVAVTTESAISFTSDVSVTGGGFQICLRVGDVVSPAPTPAFADDDADIVCSSQYKTYDDAQQWCGQHVGGNLVTVDNAATSAWVLQNGVFSDTLWSWGGNCLWIGASDAAVEGTWMWASGSAVSWSDWAPGEPNSYGGSNEDCALMCSGLWADDVSGKWLDVGCGTSAPFCCDRGQHMAPTPSPVVDVACPNGWSSYKGACYQVTETTHTYSECATACGAGALASVDDAAGNAFLLNLMNAGTAKVGFYIGYTDQVTEGVWVWDDASHAHSYTNWASTEPNDYDGEDCAAVLGANNPWGLQGQYTNGHWVDIDCVGGNGYSDGWQCACEMGGTGGAPAPTPLPAPAPTPVPAPVPTLATCTNGVLDTASGETDIDCGGAYCPPCGIGKACAVTRDCGSKWCVDATCAAAPTEAPPSHSHAGTDSTVLIIIISLSVVGGVIVLAAAGFAGYLLYKKRQNASHSGRDERVFGLVQMQDKGYANFQDEEL